MTSTASRPVARPSSRSGLLAPYAQLRRAAGAPYLLVAFLARLPVTLVPVSVLAAVTTGTGSVAVGGLASAATAVGEAVGGPTLGALADRLARAGGQRPVLLVAGAVHVAALLTVAVGAGALPVPLLLAATLVAGLALPPVGAFSRARWMRRTPHLVPTAMAAESAADEVAFVLGPALAGLVALAGSPATSLWVAAGLVVVAVPAFALHRSATGAGAPPAPADPPAGPSAGPSAGPGAPAGPVAGRLALLRATGTSLAAAAALGLFFGANTTTVTAAAEEAGRVEVAGLLVSALAVGAAVTAVAVVLVPASVGHAARLGASAGVLLVGVAAMAASLALSGSLLVLGLAVVVAGLAVGPAMVSLTSLAAARAPHGRGTTAMTLVGSGVVVGVGTGAAAAGWLAEHHGALAATGVLALAGLGLFAAAAAVGLGSRRAAGSPA